MLTDAVSSSAPARPCAGSEPSAHRRALGWGWSPACCLAEVTHDNDLVLLLPIPSHMPQGIVVPFLTSPVHRVYGREGVRGWAAASTVLVALEEYGAAIGNSRWTHFWDMSPAWGHQWCGMELLGLNPELTRAPQTCP